MVSALFVAVVRVFANALLQPKARRRTAIPEDSYRISVDIGGRHEFNEDYVIRWVLKGTLCGRAEMIRRSSAKDLLRSQMTIFSPRLRNLDMNMVNSGKEMSVDSGASEWG